MQIRNEVSKNKNNSQTIKCTLWIYVRHALSSPLIPASYSWPFNWSPMSFLVSPFILFSIEQPDWSFKNTNMIIQNKSFKNTLMTPCSCISGSLLTSSHCLFRSLLPWFCSYLSASGQTISAKFAHPVYSYKFTFSPPHSLTIPTYTFEFI